MTPLKGALPDPRRSGSRRSPPAHPPLRKAHPMAHTAVGQRLEDAAQIGCSNRVLERRGQRRKAGADHQTSTADSAPGLLGQTSNRPWAAFSARRPADETAREINAIANKRSVIGSNDLTTQSSGFIVKQRDAHHLANDRPTFTPVHSQIMVTGPRDFTSKRDATEGVRSAVVRKGFGSLGLNSRRRHNQERRSPSYQTVLTEICPPVRVQHHQDPDHALDYQNSGLRF